MKVLDLFSGIGGFSLGLERAGMSTEAFCEIDPYCRKVLAKHWPNVPIHENVKELDGGQYRNTIDVICGGYPCQPFSLAGKRAGANDDRHLWPEVARLIREIRPAWFIGENVSGHITMGLDDVLSDLEGLSYTTEAFVIPACAIDAPHRRDRVWIIANTVEPGIRADARAHRASEKEREKLQQENRQALPNDPDQARKTLADTNNNRQQPGSRGGCSRESPKERNNTGRDGKAISDALRGGFSRGGAEPAHSNIRTGNQAAGRWPIEPSVGRVAHGIPRRVDRLRALGNAVVPQIPEIIGKAIMQSRAA